MMSKNKNLIVYLRENLSQSTMGRLTLPVFVALALTLSPVGANAQKASKADKEVAKILSKMSLEEKVGQMTQVNLNVVLKGGYANQDGSIDPVLLDSAINHYYVGSILNAINHAYSVDKWHEIITAIQDKAKETPNQIPVLYGIDAIHGTTFTLESTLFPHNIGLAATRNPELVKKGAQITAKETRASGIRWNFDPVLDLGREPLWPRFAETWGEDVYITTQMGLAVFDGYQADGLDRPTAVAGCMKHYVGYSVPASGKDRTPAYIPERQLREYFLPQFKAAIEAGAATIMINSGEVNGIPVHGSKYLLTDVLRGEFGFKGLAVSDWEDIIRLHTRHKVAATPKEAVKMAVLAGVDMSMVPHDYTFFNYLVELVNEGEVPMERIDEAVKRILKVKYDVGLFDNPYPEADAKKNFGLKEYKAAALQAAQESITLLKNDEASKDAEKAVLPLPKKGVKVLVAGPGANNVTNLNGCWSYTWQGDQDKWYPESNKTIYEAIRDKIGEENTVLAYDKRGYKRRANYKPERITENIEGVDYIILCLGEDAYAESPGLIMDLTLEDRQLDLMRAAIESKVPVILVLTEGRPRVIPDDLLEDIPGVLLAYWPGSQGANAIADVIFGDYNPNGILPFSYPRNTGDIVHYDHKYSEVIQEVAPGRFAEGGYNPQWPFGFGLSYTTFEYSDITLSSNTLTGSGSIKVSVEVKNTGKRDGLHTVELYSHDKFASITPSMKRLRKFKKVNVPAGKSVTVEFELKKEDLAFIGVDNKWVTEPGEFELYIGDKTATFTYKK